MSQFITSLLVEEEGATIVEYALMVALIAIAALAAIGLLASAMNRNFTSMATSLGG